MKKSQLIIFTLLLLSCNISSQIFLEDENFSEKDYPLVILSEGFNTGTFPPYMWTSQIISGSFNWSYAYNGGYCESIGSASFLFFNASNGSVARLMSPVFVPTSEGRDSLVFHEAYCQRPGITDALEIYVSTNMGSVWLLLATYTSGELATAPSSNTFFTPSCSQWQSKSVYLPLNTNKIFFQATGGGGNNLYLDNVLVKPSGLVGIIPYSTEVPVKYELYNNYPNPFNPSTKIRFDITKRTNVKIVIYNSAGMEITVLVDSQLGAGKYETSFTALDLPSGVYFYKLIADSFSDTKKMILLK